MTTMTQTTAVDHEAKSFGSLAQLSLKEKVRLMTGADIWALHPIPEDLACGAGDVRRDDHSPAQYRRRSRNREAAAAAHPVVD